MLRSKARFRQATQTCNSSYYGKWSKSLNTFSLFSNKMSVIRAGIHKNTLQNSKQRRPWSDCFFRSSLIWVCTFCLGVFDRQLVLEILEHLPNYSIIIGRVKEFLSKTTPQKALSNFSPVNNFIIHTILHTLFHLSQISRQLYYQRHW